MYKRSCFWKRVGFVIVLVVLLGLSWTMALGAVLGPDIEGSPGYEQEVNAGDIVVYHHIITNTGDVTAPVDINSQVPAGWGITYATTTRSDTTIWMPRSLPSSSTLPLTISLSSPFTATSRLYTSTITVTLLSSPVVEFPVYELTYIRERFIYLPLVLRNYTPFRNGSFENGEKGLSGWTVPDETKLPVAVVNSAERDNTEPSEGERMLLLGNPKYPCSGVPQGYAAAEQKFVVPTNAISVTFDYVIWMQDVSLDETYDRFEVYLWKDGDPMPETPEHDDGNMVTEGVGCDKWWRVPPEESEWKEGSVDLKKYQGQMVNLSFRVYNRQDNWYNTYTYVDNVRIVVEE